jgi:hypothetical protein
MASCLAEATHCTGGLAPGCPNIELHDFLAAAPFQWLGTRNAPNPGGRIAYPQRFLSQTHPNLRTFTTQ